MSYPNYIFSIFAFIGFVLAIIPLRWHLNAWNAGTCLYMLWTGVACLNQFVNSVVWDGNVINHAPVWCDISIRIILGASMAIPAASLCINRRLYRISCLTTVKITNAEKLRDIGVDLAIALGIPILFIILSYIPQGHRFDIYEDLGCVPVSYMTPVQLALVQLPPIAIGFITAVYSILSMRAFFNRNRKLQALISDHESMNTNRYFRLMCLAGIDVVLTVPLGSFAAYQSITTGGGIHPWISWEDTHWGFARHEIIPAFLWRRVPAIESAIEFNRWQIIMCSFIFFAFFGFAEEARHNYRSAFWFVAGHFGYRQTATAVSESKEAKQIEDGTATLDAEGHVDHTRRGISILFSRLAIFLCFRRKTPLLPITFAPNTFSTATSLDDDFSPSNKILDGPSSSTDTIRTSSL